MNRTPVTVTLFGFLLAFACAGDADPSGESVGPGDASTVSEASSTGGSTGAASGSESTSIPTTGPVGPKSCRRECQAAFECCPAGLDECPSMAYPGNFGCAGELCVPASCGGDDECQATLPGSSCVELDGVLQCVVLCNDDDDVCTSINPAMTCGPSTDLGRDYCSLRCDSDAIICPFGCDEQTGRCSCADEGDCAAGFRCG